MEKPTKVKTSTLLGRVFKASNLKRFMDENDELFLNVPFHLHISEMCREVGMVPEQIIKQTGIERTYGHQIFNGTRKPSRDKVIQLALGFRLDTNGTQELLKAANKRNLYPKIRRDAALIYCLEHHMNEVETQNVLMELNLTLLGGGQDG